MYQRQFQLAALAAVTCLGGQALAQDPASPQPASAPFADILIADGAGDQIVRLTDFNGDGIVMDELEVTRLAGLDDGAGTGVYSPRAVDFRDESGTPVTYWVDTQTDIIYRGVDSNFNGRIENSEISSFASIGVASPDGVFATDDGKVWCTSDGSADQGVFYAEDTNADGVADNFFQLLSGNVQFSLDTYATDGTGTATITGIPFPEVSGSENDFFQGCAAGNSVVVFSRGNSAAVRVEDKNNDGDTADAGEAFLMVNAGDFSNSALPINADWASGSLKSLEVSDGVSTIGHAFLDYWGSRVENGAQVFYFCTGVSSSSSFGFNVDGEFINGLIFRGEDLDGDGDLQDAGEVTLWYDGSDDAVAPQGIQQIVALDVADDGIYVYDLNNGGRSVHRLRDDDRNGNAMDFGEQDVDYFNFSAYNPLNSFTPPFESTDFMFVYDMATATPQAYGGGFEALGIGTGCSQFGPGPAIGGTGVARIGTADFSSVVTNTQGGLPALLGMGSLGFWLGIPLPFDLSPFGLPGCVLYQSGFLSFPAQILGGSTASDGFGVQPVFIPSDAGLIGLRVGVQWLVIDVFTTFTIAMSNGLAVTIAP